MRVSSINQQRPHELTFAILILVDIEMQWLFSIADKSATIATPILTFILFILILLVCKCGGLIRRPKIVCKVLPLDIDDLRKNLLCKEQEIYKLKNNIAKLNEDNMKLKTQNFDLEKSRKNLTLRYYGRIQEALLRNDNPEAIDHSVCKNVITALTGGYETACKILQLSIHGGAVDRSIIDEFLKHSEEIKSFDVKAKFEWKKNINEGIQTSTDDQLQDKIEKNWSHRKEIEILNRIIKEERQKHVWCYEVLRKQDTENTELKKIIGIMNEKEKKLNEIILAKDAVYVDTMKKLNQIEVELRKYAMKKQISSWSRS